jgi:cation transport ATPase
MYLHISRARRVRRYQKSNKNLSIEEGQTTQRSQEEGQTTQRSQEKDRQHNGQKKKDRQHNGQKKDKQHIGQKKKDRQHNGQKKKDKQRFTKHTHRCSILFSTVLSHIVVVSFMIIFLWNKVG